MPVAPKHPFSDDLIGLLDHSVSGKIILAPQGDLKDVKEYKVLYVNPSTTRLIGIAGPEIGEKASKVLSGFKDNNILELAGSVLITGVASSQEAFWNQNGKTRWLLIQLVKLSEHLILTLVDLHQQKQAENDLKRKELLLTESQDIANVGSWSWKLNKPEEDSVIWSKQVYKIYEVDDLDFKPSYNFFKETIVPEDRNKIEHIIEEALKNSEAYELKYRIKVKGQLKYLEARAIPKLDQDNNLEEYVGIIRDVTFERDQEKILQRSQRRLKWMEKVASSQRIAKSIAHEIRNPLTNIALATEQLRSEIDEQSRDMFLDMIARNGIRIDKLIKELMKSAKPDELKVARYDINDIVDSALVLAIDRAKLRNVKIIKEYELDMCDVEVDQEKVQTALLNVLINAIEAVEDGSGTVKIETELTEEECIVRISDNGEGIEKDKISHLFDPFYTGTKKGLGLGLTTTLSIIDSHNGNIEVESEVGEGTTFILSFKR